MNSHTLEQVVREYLPQIIHMSVATMGQDNKPWAFEVHFAYDDDLNLYWVSDQTTRHSQDITVNPHVAGAIVVQHAPDDAPLGVSFEGIVEILQDVDEHHPAFKTYIERFPAREQIIREAYEQKTDTGRRIYKVVVSDYYLNGVIDGKMSKRHLPWPNTER